MPSSLTVSVFAAPMIFARGSISPSCSSTKRSRFCLCGMVTEAPLKWSDLKIESMSLRLL